MLNKKKRKERRTKNKGKILLLFVTKRGKNVEKEHGSILVHLLKESVSGLLQTLFHNHVTYRLKMTPGIKQFILKNPIF